VYGIVEGSVFGYTKPDWLEGGVFKLPTEERLAAALAGACVGVSEHDLEPPAQREHAGESDDAHHGVGLCEERERRGEEGRGGRGEGEQKPLERWTGAQKNVPLRQRAMPP